MYSQICIFIHILIKLISFLSELLTFNWVCITVIIKWEGNEVSVSSTCHRYTLTLTWEGWRGGLVCPPMRHTMAITTQLTLSIYINKYIYIYTNVHAQRPTHTRSHKQQEKEWKGCLPSLSIDPVTATATPVVGPVKLDRKRNVF